MLAVEKIGIQFGGRRLFSDLSFVLKARERLSLAGPNGAGKSTLLKIIAGIEESDSGRIVRSKHRTVGYLPQEGVAHRGRPFSRRPRLVFGDVLRLRDEPGGSGEGNGSAGPGSRR